MASINDRIVLQWAKTVPLKFVTTKCSWVSSHLFPLHIASVLDIVPLNYRWINVIPVVCSLNFGTVCLYWDIHVSMSFMSWKGILNVLLFYIAIFMHVLFQLLPNCFIACIPCICFVLHYPSPLYLHRTYLLGCIPFIVGVFFPLFTGLLTCLIHDANISDMTFGSVEKERYWRCNSTNEGHVMKSLQNNDNIVTNRGQEEAFCHTPTLVIWNILLNSSMVVCVFCFWHI